MNSNDLSVSPSLAKYHLYDSKLHEQIESLGEKLSMISDVADFLNPTYAKLFQLYTDLLRQERRQSLNEMYVGERIADAAERLAAEEDPKVAQELATLLKVL